MVCFTYVIVLLFLVGAKPGFEICCKSLLNVRKFVEIFFYCVKSQELLAMRIIRAVTDRRQIISFPFFVYKDTLEDKSYPVYSVETVSPDRCIQWRIQGRGPGAPLFFSQN